MFYTQDSNYMGFSAKDITPLEHERSYSCIHTAHCEVSP